MISGESAASGMQKLSHLMAKDLVYQRHFVAKFQFQPFTASDITYTFQNVRLRNLPRHGQSQRQHMPNMRWTEMTGIRSEIT
jgi:hypothetical protein